jgi:SAM-dependent methyltransferase
MDSACEQPCYHTRLCPICGCGHSEHLFRQRFHAISGAGLLDGYDVVECTQCGFGYADNIPDQEAFDAYYRDLSKYEYRDRGGESSEFDVSAFRFAADLIEDQIPSRSSLILDIGCATGGLLAVLKARGFSHVLGADPSPACAEAALRLHAIRVLTTPFSGLTIDGEPPES